MGRGRPSEVSDERLLIELLLYPDRAILTSQLKENLPVTAQTVRQRMRELERSGYVEIEEMDGGNLYRITMEGLVYISKRLRSDYS